MRDVRVRFGVGLGVASAVSLGLLCTLSLVEGELTFPFLIWNLFLAWLPLGLSYWLWRVLKRKAWSSWEAIGITVAWLALLPNSFYVLSDFVHLNELPTDQIMLGAVTIASFVFASLCLGFVSLYLVHTELLRRIRRRSAAGIVGGLLLIVSGAIYVGRDLRWNSWDVLLNPFGLLFDISDRLLHPSQYGGILLVIVPFFVLLATAYYVTWQVISLSRSPNI